MGQLNFVYNHCLPLDQKLVVSNGTITFFPLNIGDSISFNTVNFLGGGSSANRTITISLGLYSLSGSSLSLGNSISGTSSMNNALIRFVSLTGTSATQNITPGTWYWGLLISTGGNSNYSFYGNSYINPSNAFPGGFIGGRMTDSSGALPSSYATSNLDITGNDAMFTPLILLSS